MSLMELYRDPVVLTGTVLFNHLAQLSFMVEDMYPGFILQLLTVLLGAYLTSLCINLLNGDNRVA